MSNNACRLLFRVGETHWIIQGQDSLSCEKWHGGSDACGSLIFMQEPSVIPQLTLAVTAAATRVAQKVAGTRVLPVSAGLLHTARVRRKDYGELAAPCLSSPKCLFTVHHVPRCAGLVPMYKKNSRLLFYNELFCFLPEVCFCFGTLAMSIALKRLS